MKTKNIEAVLTTVTIDTKVDAGKIETVIGESAKMEVQKAVNYIQSGKAEIDAAVDARLAEIDAEGQEYVDLAKDWAIKTDGTVDGVDYSSKYYAQSILPIASEIVTVAGISSEVSAVGGAINEVTSVANDLTNIDNVANDLTNIDTVAGISSDISTTAGIASDISAVAANETNINAVNANKTNIDAVAGNATNINSVVSNETNINAVAGNSSNINTVAGISSDVTTVANNTANINSVVSDLTNINNVAGDLTNIDNVANDLTNINNVAGDLSNIDSVVSNSANINTVAGNISDVSTVAGISSDVSTVVGMASDITTVNNNATNINTVSSNISNVNAVAGDLTNINAVAGDLTNIDNASTYAAQAKQWAIGDPTEPTGNSSKYWADQAAAAVSSVTSANKVIYVVDTYADLQAYDTTNVTPNSIIKVIADETNSGKTSWYQWSMQGGETPFVQPALTANGTINGNSFACASDGVWSGDNSRQPYKAFNGNSTFSSSNFWDSGSGQPHWIEFYNPTPLTVTNIKIYNGENGSVAKDWQFQCSDDNSTWTTLTSGSNTTTGQGNNWSFSVPNSGAHKYYRFYTTSSQGQYSTHLTICEIEITATVAGTYDWAKIKDEGKYLTGITSGDVTTALGYTPVNPSNLATVATSGSYNDLLNKPTIPTVNNATLTIQKNGVDVQTFTANASSNVTANITVPTNTNELTNGAGFITGITSSDVTTALGYTPANDSAVVKTSGNQTIGGEKTFSSEIKGFIRTYCAVNNASPDNASPYKKIAEAVLTGAYISKIVPFTYVKTNPTNNEINSCFNGEITLRVESTAGTFNAQASGIGLSFAPEFINNGKIAFYLAYKNNYPESNQVTCQIWVKVTDNYSGVAVTPLNNRTGSANWNYFTDWTWGNNLTAAAEIPNDFTVINQTLSLPYAPTPLTSNNSSRVATTAFVKAQGYLTATESKSGDGYVKFSNGIIIQWGSLSGGTTTATLPTAFTTTDYRVVLVASPGNASATYNAVLDGDSLTTTGFTIGVSSSVSVKWIAIGW